MSSHGATIEEWLEFFKISDETLCHLTSQFSIIYADLALHSCEQFLATPIVQLPSGKEQGEYLAIDLGGTNLRIAFITLLGTEYDGSYSHERMESGLSSDAENRCLSEQNIIKTCEKSWSIEERFKVENSEDLFSWVGDCLAEVVRARYGDPSMAKDIPDEIPFGITFSFPMMQSSLNEATIMPMGKGFAINSPHDLGAMICEGYAQHTRHDAVASHALPRLKICAITNDAVATFVTSVYSTRPMLRGKTVVGLILGTGCNAAAPMRLHSLGPSKWPTIDGNSQDTEVVVNTEWTIKGAAEPLHKLQLVTRWDAAISASTFCPGFQPFEYMTGGHYLGQIVRVILLDWYTNVMLIPEHHLPPSLVNQNALTTTFLAQVVSTTANSRLLASELNRTKALGYNKHWRWNSELANVLMKTEKAVLQRSAALVAAALVGLLFTTGDLILKAAPSLTGEVGTKDETPSSVQELVVSYCGGLICQYYDYHEQVQAKVDRLVDVLASNHQSVKVVLKEASEGGLVGAAILAHVARNGPAVQQAGRR